MQNSSNLSFLFSESVRLWKLALAFQARETENRIALNTSNFIQLDKENVKVMNKIKAAITLYSNAKASAISKALAASSKYSLEKYGVTMGKKYLFEVPGWTAFEMTVDIIKPAGAEKNPMVVCMGYSDDNKRKSVILSSNAKITPISSTVVDIRTLLNVRAGKVPLTISVK